MNLLETLPATDLTNIETLCFKNDPYGTFDDELFVKAMKENVLWHQMNNGFYRRLLESKQFDPLAIDTISDIGNIPFIIATFFKQCELLSVSRDKISLHLTSSGTTGQKSQIFFDSWSIGVAQRMLDNIFKYYNWIDKEQEVNYLLYSYEPKKQNDKLGTAYTDNYLCKYTKVNSVHYALKESSPGKYEFDLFGTLDCLVKFAKEGLPVRIFGFPAFFHFTLELLKSHGGISKPLHPESLVFLGGGWKGNQEKAISKLELYKNASKLLGIPDERLRDGFGSVEHCIPYVECKCHNFHIPIWSKVIIRDVTTLKPLRFGETGYLNFISPYITSVPANSVLMTDLAVMHAGDECGCELNTPYFEIVGRAGISKSKSCAITALDLLKGKQ